MVWPQVVSALSIAVIALVALVAGAALLMLFGELRRLSAELRRVTQTLDRDAAPALQSVRTAAEDVGQIVATVREEVDGIVGTSQNLRTRVEGAVISVEDRLRDIETLLDVVLEEVEDTALDVAAALRTTRRGGRLFKRMKRALVGRRR